MHAVIDGNGRPIALCNSTTNMMPCSEEELFPPKAPLPPACSINKKIFSLFRVF